MTIVSPAILAENAHQYREQIGRVQSFAKAIHIDFADEKFTDSSTIDLQEAWWPPSIQADLHLMFETPGDYTEALLKLRPRLVIVHAEASINIREFVKALHVEKIKVGLAILSGTGVDTIQQYFDVIDHVLVFSGNLGHFGGSANLNLLEKVIKIRKISRTVEIGWDGGVNDKNAQALVDAGVNVLNVGGYIQRARNPRASFDSIENLLH